MSELPPVKIPRIARAGKRTKIAPFALGLGVIGTAVFASLASHRADRQEQASALPPLRTTTITAPAPPPPAVIAQATTPVAIPIQMPPPPPPVAAPYQPPRPYPTVPVARAPRSDGGAAERARARISAPALIVDLPPARPSGESLRGQSSSLENTLLAAALMRNASLQDPTGAAIAAAGPAAETALPVVPVVPVDSGARDLNGNERFANRAGNKDTEVARAQRLPNQDMLVAQGTIIGAVMESALNSDLPGFARAVVTRDVLSFDGSQVLIPAGSHVIGEYNSGVAQGASRIFIVWNRLIRPDGVSVALASPAVDDLGRGGLGGKVDRHFFQRFGGAILLSVLTGGIGAFTQSLSRGSTVIVSSTNEATSLAGQASKGNDIPPTITTRQGALVRIFVARDLDFSAVGPTI